VSHHAVGKNLTSHSSVTFDQTQKSTSHRSWGEIGTNSGDSMWTSYRENHYKNVVDRVVYNGIELPTMIDRSGDDFSSTMSRYITEQNGLVTVNASDWVTSKGFTFAGTSVLSGGTRYDGSKVHNRTYTTNAQNENTPVSDYAWSWGNTKQEPETFGGPPSWWDDTWAMAVWNNGGEILRVVGGVFEVGVGAAMMLTTGLAGIVVGFVTSGMGIDNILTGISNIQSGQHNKSVFEFGVYRVTGNETASLVVPMLTLFATTT